MTRRLAVALGVVATLVGALGVQGIGAATSAVAATTTASPVVSVAPAQFGDLRSGQPLRLFLTLDDQSAAGISAGTATVAIDRRAVASRDDLEDWFTGSTKASAANVKLAAESTPDVLPSSSSVVSISVPATSLHLGASGVYAIAVTVKSGSATIGTARTAVAWKTNGTRSVPVALAAPLTVPAENATFISSATLAADTAPTGILTRELDDLEDSQVAIGIDPRILASIRILGKSAPESARDWLVRLEAVPNDTFPLAWGDADLTVALQAGEQTVPGVKPLDYAISPSQFKAADNSSTGVPTPTSTPDPANPPLPTSQSLVAFNYTVPDLSWPAENTVVPSDVTKLQNSGIAAAILSSENVKRSASRIPGGASAKVGDLSIAISDATISNDLRDAVAATTREAWTSAMARLTTSLALIGDESGGNANIVLATLGRGWQDADLHLGDTLTGMYTRPWITTASLQDATTAKPATVTIVSKPQPESRIARVRQMLAEERREVRFAVVTAPDQETLTSSRRLILLSLLSDEWLDDPAGWDVASSLFLSQSNKIVTSVQVVKSGDVVLLGDQVPLPITISNELDQPVTVYIAIRPTTTQVAVDKAHRLQEVTINAQSQRLTRIPIQSISNGKAKVRVTLYSSSGHRIGETSVINVDVRAGWETVGTLIFAALVIGVFAFGLVRNIRKRRKAATADGADGDDADGVPASE
jgi:hypothetical protein